MPHDTRKYINRCLDALENKSEDATLEEILQHQPVSQSTGKHEVPGLEG